MLSVSKQTSHVKTFTVEVSTLPTENSTHLKNLKYYKDSESHIQNPTLSVDKNEFLLNPGINKLSEDDKAMCDSPLEID